MRKNHWGFLRRVALREFAESGGDFRRIDGAALQHRPALLTKRAPLARD
jgi:hypothetical protein